MIDIFGLASSGGHSVHVVNKPVNTEFEGGDVFHWYTIAQELRAKYESLLDEYKQLDIGKTDNFYRLAERKANGAGLRAVIRMLLQEIRQTDPNNRMLQKHLRQAIFDIHRDEFIKEYLAKVKMPQVQMKEPEGAITE